MGRPEGPGCYCYANNVLRGVIERLAKGYDYIVVDNEAGMEHLSRRTNRKIDLLFLISDYSVVGVRTVRRIASLVKALNISTKDAHVVINKTSGDVSCFMPEIDASGLSLGGCIPLDDDVFQRSVNGKGLLDLPENSGIVSAVEKILSETVGR
jgi:CO dehydrogenase maturation factor